MLENRNLILAVVLSLLILLGFQYFMPGPQESQRQPDTSTTAGQAPAAPAAQPGAAPGSTPAGATPLLDRSAALEASPRIVIDTPSLEGSIALTGGRIDDVTLRKFRQTTDPASREIELLSPANAKAPYFAEFGWQLPAGVNLPLPNDQTVWTGSGKLTPTTPVTLTWDNGAGLLFTRKISLDENYMFTIEDKVENKGASAVDLYPYGLLRRIETPEIAGEFIVHEGPLGVLGGQLQEHAYDKLRDETVPDIKSKGGWLGITDKYWLSAIIPDQGREITGSFRHTKVGQRDTYEVSFLDGAQKIEAGASATVTHRLFAGAKVVDLLRAYRDDLGIGMFEYAVDFGWFFFLTKPIFIVLDFFYRLIGNFGVAIMILTLIIKGLFYPLQSKSYRAMNKMKDAQPEMAKLRERFGDDKPRMQQELMALYKKEKINPLAGCLPILIQIPVFFALYKVLNVSIEMRHAPFFGWIQDLAAPDPTHVLNLFGLIPWDPPSFLALGAWPLAMGISMFLQQKMNPAPPDPVQQRVFMMMPIIFTFFLANFAAGLVIYWTWNNLLSIGQQWLIRKQTPPKIATVSAVPEPAAAKGAPTGGKPTGKR